MPFESIFHWQSPVVPECRIVLALEAAEEVGRSDETTAEEVLFWLDVAEEVLFWLDVAEEVLF